LFIDSLTFDSYQIVPQGAKWEETRDIAEATSQGGAECLLIEDIMRIAGRAINRGSKIGSETCTPLYPVSFWSKIFL